MLGCKKRRDFLALHLAQEVVGWFWRPEGWGAYCRVFLFVAWRACTFASASAMLTSVVVGVSAPLQGGSQEPKSWY
jgi:hypothetical protein